MGFFDAIDEIHLLRRLTHDQTLLFSATYPDTIRKMSSSIQRNPVTITVESEHQDSVIEQLPFYEVNWASSADDHLISFV